MKSHPLPGQEEPFRGRIPHRRSVCPGFLPVGGPPSGILRLHEVVEDAGFCIIFQASAGKHGQRSFIAIAQETIECSLQSLKAGGLDLLSLSFL